MSEQARLIQAARAAAANSYAPYSRVQRGAALQAADGSVFSGAGMECAAYPGAVCAETAALVSAVSAGKRRFVRLALWPFRMPCGSCRQRLREFGLELEIVSADEHGAQTVTTLAELLPESFGPANLGQLREACDS